MADLLFHPAVIIPAYQPDEKLLTLVQSLRQHHPHLLIIVINDGSDPGLQDLFRKLLDFRIELLHHPVNLGKGQALKTGFVHYLKIAGQNPLGVVTADADGQHALADILALCESLVREQQHLHLGVRNITLVNDKTKIPLRSKIGNVLTSFIFRKISAIPLYDTQTGLRGIPAHLLKLLINSRSRGYELEMEMLLMAKKRGVKIKQIPIETIYFDNNSRSHFNPWRDSLKIYSLIARFIING